MVAPVLLFAPFTGAWVDRMNLKRALIVSDLMRALVVLAIPWLYTLTGHTGTAFALVFVLFTCNVFFLPAKSAITPEIVPADQLLAANSLLTIAGIAATSIGALMGGWVVDHWGWKFAMQVDAVTYAVSVVTLMVVAYKHSAHHARLPELSAAGYLREVGEGWRVVTRSDRVRLALLALGAVWIGGLPARRGEPRAQRASPGWSASAFCLDARHEAAARGGQHHGCHLQRLLWRRLPARRWPGRVRGQPAFRGVRVSSLRRVVHRRRSYSAKRRCGAQPVSARASQRARLPMRLAFAPLRWPRGSRGARLSAVIPTCAGADRGRRYRGTRVETRAGAPPAPSGAALRAGSLPVPPAATSMIRSKPSARLSLRAAWTCGIARPDDFVRGPRRVARDADLERRRDHTAITPTPCARLEESARVPPATGSRRSRSRRA
jgi:hypothetical protein